MQIGKNDFLNGQTIKYKPENLRTVGNMSFPNQLSQIGQINQTPNLQGMPAQGMMSMNKSGMGLGNMMGPAKPIVSQPAMNAGQPMMNMGQHMITPINPMGPANPIVSQPTTNPCQTMGLPSQPTTSPCQTMGLPSQPATNPCQTMGLPSQQMGLNASALNQLGTTSSQPGTATPSISGINRTSTSSVNGDTNESERSRVEFIQLLTPANIDPFAKHYAKFVNSIVMDTIKHCKALSAASSSRFQDTSDEVILKSLVDPAATKTTGKKSVMGNAAALALSGNKTFNSPIAPNTKTKANISPELKEKLDSMKNMMKSTFDAQPDEYKSQVCPWVFKSGNNSGCVCAKYPVNETGMCTTHKASKKSEEVGVNHGLSLANNVMKTAPQPIMMSAPIGGASELITKKSDINQPVNNAINTISTNIPMIYMSNDIGLDKIIIQSEQNGGGLCAIGKYGGDFTINNDMIILPEDWRNKSAAISTIDKDRIIQGKFDIKIMGMESNVTQNTQQQTQPPLFMKESAAPGIMSMHSTGFGMGR